MMWAHLHWLTGDIAELRLFDDGAVFGEPYQWSCVVLRKSPTEAEIRLDDKPLPRGGRQAIDKALRSEGFTAATWERRTRGQARQVRKTAKETP